MIFVVILLIIYCLYVTTLDRNFQLYLLYSVLGIMILLPLIDYRESIQKIKALFRFEIELTRGAVFCVVFLPVLYKLWESRHIEVVNRQIFVFVFSLLVAIFNYGIRCKKTELI